MRTGFEESWPAIRRDSRARLIAMAIFKKPTLKAQPRKKRDIPQGLFQKCPGCNEVVSEIELNENLRVCPRCDYHFALSAKDRKREVIIAPRADPEIITSRFRPRTGLRTSSIR